MRLLVGVTCIAMAIGCGDDGNVGKLPDAPPPPDADVDASNFGPVTLTVLFGDTPQANVPVYFQNADSSLVSETTTDADGKARAEMAPGGFVTAINPLPIPQGGGQTDIRTFAGVKPGDQLRLFASAGSSAQTVNVTFLLPTAAGAADYRLSTNCLFDFPVGGGGGSGSGSGPGQATLQLSGCGGTSNLLIETRDFNGNPLSFIYKPSVALANNGTVDLTADTYTAMPDVTFSYSNLPVTAGNVNIFTLRATAAGQIYSQFANAPADSGTASVTTKIPTIPNAVAITISSFDGESTGHSIADWGAPAANNAVDVGAAVLPNFASEPTLDVPNHKISWTNTGGGVQPDFVVVDGFLRRTQPSSQSWRWSVAAPAANQAVLPVLPAAHAALNPVDGDFANFEAELSKVPGGYDAVRANILSDDGFSPYTPPGPSGRAQNAYYQPGGKGITRPMFETQRKAQTGVLRGLRKR